MTLIYDSDGFVVRSHDRPHVDRSDGGHIVIDPRVPVPDRQALDPRLAVELMRLTVVVGEAMAGVMNEHGVDIGRINYQDNGNWMVFDPEGPELHVHLYGRARSARNQPYGQALVFPDPKRDPSFYAGLEPLTADDVAAIRVRIEQLSSEERFSDAIWGLA